MARRKSRMATVKLTRDRYALIDSEDRFRVGEHSWHYSNAGYAVCNRKTGVHSRKYMHRFILKYPKGNIDHINGNKLDNRKVNLRLCNQSQNMANAPRRRNNTSGFKGVSWDKRAKKWAVTITKDYKHIFGGYFENKTVAAMRYNYLAKLHFGEFAKTN